MILHIIYVYADDGFAEMHSVPGLVSHAALRKILTASPLGGFDYGGMPSEG